MDDNRKRAAALVNQITQQDSISQLERDETPEMKIGKALLKKLEITGMELPTCNNVKKRHKVGASQFRKKDGASDKPKETYESIE